MPVLFTNPLFPKTTSSTCQLNEHQSLHQRSSSVQKDPLGQEEAASAVQSAMLQPLSTGAPWLNHATSMANTISKENQLDFRRLLGP